MPTVEGVRFGDTIQLLKGHFLVHDESYSTSPYRRLGRTTMLNCLSSDNTMAQQE